MGKDTGIQWCDSTVNPTSGCAGCELWKPGVGGPCYAGNLHVRRLAKALPEKYAPTFEEVRLIPGRMAQAAGWGDLRERPRAHPQFNKPWLDGLPRIIFIGDLGDVLSRDVPLEYLRDEIVAHVDSVKGRRHVWMMLTKYPARAVQLAAFLARHGQEWPRNLWLGTSLTSQASLARVRHLAAVPAPRRFLSLEPQVGAIDLGDLLLRHAGLIHQVIVGGESSQGAHAASPFPLEWAYDSVAACRDHNVKFFLKQLGSYPVGRDGMPLRLKDHHGGDWSEWDPALRVREVPRPAA